jgi:shikimate kinase
VNRADGGTDSARAPHLVLVGLMGAGKSTVGARCAARLGRELVDTDDLVELHARASVAEIFASDGEAGFRARERAAVADAVASPGALVVSCGGGAVIDAANRAALRAGGVVVWLDGPSDVLAARVAGDTGRPLLASGDRVATLDRLARLRADAYEACAHARVDTTSLDIDEVADRVLACYEEHRRGA